ncbi:hypothetical protein EYR36_011613 [Pleurotus pulmonarius]|nr:hypothetical protein EYR36_011613 [Pleurotus pulmonarius]
MNSTTSVNESGGDTEAYPTDSEIREHTFRVFNKRPCLWQIKVAQAVLRQKQDIVSIAGTGMGKTLTFWIPLLFKPNHIQIIVTPLNILGQQNVQVLKRAGLNGVFVGADTATPDIFQSIEELKYQAVVVSPEQLMKDGGRFERLLRDETFTSRILSIIFDEAHCINLNFLVRNWKRGSPPPKKFLVFFDDINDAIKACIYLRSLLPPEEHVRDKINWFCSNMSATFKAEETVNIVQGRTWGLCTTESFGMGMDISDLEVIVQWRASCSFTTWWQRGGRGARNPSLNATFVFLVEKEYFDHGEPNQAGDKRNSNTLSSEPSQDPESPAKRHRTGSVNSSTAINPETDKSDILRKELQAKYFMKDPAKSNQKVKGRQKRQFDAVLADVVNAKERGINCRRIPILCALENEKADSDHFDCDPVHDGCTRCFLPLPRLCCDICHPHAFAEFDVATHRADPQPSRSRIDPKTPMNVNDIALRNSLEDWREKTAIQMYGAANFREYGAGLIMSNTVLDRIVLCGHSKKLKTGADLSQETRWTLATKYANEILALVHRHTVPTPCAPAFTHTPLERVNGPSAAGAPIANTACSLTAKRTNKCGACGALGHISSNCKCPEFHKRTPKASTTNAGKENTVQFPVQ